MLSLDAVLRLHERIEDQAHEQDQAALARPQRPEHVTTARCPNWWTARRAVEASDRASAGSIEAFGLVCADCCLPHEALVPTCAGSAGCVWPRGRCPRHDDGLDIGEVLRLARRSLDVDDRRGLTAR